jgi:hypothetical protein
MTYDIIIEGGESSLLGGMLEAVRTTVVGRKPRMPRKMEFPCPEIQNGDVCEWTKTVS